MQTTTRNATLADLAAMLQDQHARKLDMVVSATKLSASGGRLVVSGADPVLEADGVTSADGEYVPTSVCDEGIAEKLSIPVAYLKRTRAERPDIFDANVNGWLHGTPDEAPPTPTWENPRFAPADPRSFLLRTFTTDKGPGIARALLSDGFQMIDNLDVLTAILEAIRDSGVETEVVGCDLTDRRMYLRVAAPAVAELAPDLLRGYRSPFGPGGVDRVRDLAAAEGMGYAPGEEPIVFAGFEVSNSETGGGAFQIVPRLVVQICKNGLKVTADALRRVHLGGKLDEGVIKWSAETQAKSLDLVTSMTRDAVATFLDVAYVRRVLLDVEDKATTPIRGDSAAVVTTVCKQLKFSEERTAGILDHFIRGGQVTAGGVLQAVTSYAQTVDDADDAADLEAVALSALDAAVKVAG